MDLLNKGCKGMVKKIMRERKADSTKTDELEKLRQDINLALESLNNAKMIVERTIINIHNQKNNRRLKIAR